MTSQKNNPKDAQVMASILKDMGIIEYEPRVINQMLEFTYRYVTNILDDSRLFCSHAKKKNIDVEDVRLAIQLQMDRSFTTPPPRDILMEIARQKNNIPMPLIKANIGPRLPPDRYSLTATNYRMKSAKKPRGSISNSRLGLGPMHSNGESFERVPYRSNKMGSFPSAMSKVTPAINLSSKTGATLSVMTKGVPSPTVAISSRPIKNVPTPIIKLSSGPPLVSSSNTPQPMEPLNGESNKRKREEMDDYDD